MPGGLHASQEPCAYEGVSLLKQCPILCRPTNDPQLMSYRSFLDSFPAAFRQLGPRRGQAQLGDQEQAADAEAHLHRARPAGGDVQVSSLLYFQQWGPSTQYKGGDTVTGQYNC